MFIGELFLERPMSGCRSRKWMLTLGFARARGVTQAAGRAQALGYTSKLSKKEFPWPMFPPIART
jgi:hypothetical protein